MGKSIFNVTALIVLTAFTAYAAYWLFIIVYCLSFLLLGPQS